VQDVRRAGPVPLPKVRLHREENCFVESSHDGMLECSKLQCAVKL
jgi:hypothetical protein